MQVAPETTQTTETSTDTNELKKFEEQFALDESRQRTFGLLLLAGILVSAFALVFGTAKLMHVTETALNGSVVQGSSRE